MLKASAGVASVRSTVTRLRNHSWTVTHSSFAQALAREFYSLHDPLALGGSRTLEDQSDDLFIHIGLDEMQQMPEISQRVEHMQVSPFFCRFA